MKDAIRWFYSAPLTALMVGLAFTALAAIGLTRLEVRTDGAALHPQNARAVLATRQAAEHFQEPEQAYVLVVCRSPDAPPIDTQQGLLFVEEVHQELARLKSALAVTSVADVLDVPAEPNLLCLPSYLDSVPTSEANFPLLLQRMRAEPYVYGLLLARDGRAALLSVSKKADIDRADFVRALEKKAETLQNQHWTLMVTGPLVVETMLGEMVLDDLFVLIPIMVALMTLVLLLTLRTVAALMVVMMEVGLVLVWTLGMMGWFGVPITLVTTILPVLLMTMAVTDEIHLMERLQHFRSHQTRHMALENALQTVARPIVITSVTTAIGFLSFTTAAMEPIRDFGRFAALGMILAMVMTFTLIPALLALLPDWTFRPITPIDLTLKTADFWPKAHWLFPVLLVPAFFGLARLEVQDAWVKNFEKESSPVRADRILNQSFWGSYRFDVVLSGEAGFFHKPQGVALVSELETLARSAPHAGGVLGFLVHFDKIRALQKAGDQDYDAERLEKVLEIVKIAGDRMGIKQLLNKEGTHARLQIFVRYADHQKSLELERFIQQKLIPRLPPGVSLQVSGDLPVASAVVGEIVSNQLRSMGLTLLGIALVLMILFRSMAKMLILLLPVTVTLVLLGGVMGFLNIPLGIATSMFAAIAFGVGVDFSIHYTVAYHRARARGFGHADACHRVWAGAGRALQWNTLILAAGFLVLVVSRLKPNMLLGFLLASAMILTWQATMVLMPVCLKWTGESAGKVGARHPGSKKK